MNKKVDPAPGLSLTDHNDARENYYKKVHNLIGGTFNVGEPSALGRVFHIPGCGNSPPHFAIVTFGYSWKFGNEMIIRFIEPEDKRNVDVVIELANTLLFLIFFMQENVAFKPSESCEVAYPLPWVHLTDSGGHNGSLIIADSILHGTHDEIIESEEHNPSEPLHDENYWPQHFLCLFFLFPEEYTFCRGVALKDFIDIIASCQPYSSSQKPLFINDFSRMCYLQDSGTTSGSVCDRLADLKLRSPSQVEVNGITLDLRVRKHGYALDIVLGVRSAGPVLTALASAFTKVVVPKGTQVTARDNQCFVTFLSHDSDGNEITTQTAKYVVYFCGVGRENPNGESLILPLSREDFRYYSLMSQGHLWRGFYLGRVIQVAVYLPPSALAILPHRVNDALADRSCMDFDAEPLVIDFNQRSELMFTGLDRECGFAKEVSAGMHEVSIEPSRMRLVLAGGDYFSDKMFIQDNGEFLYTT